MNGQSWLWLQDGGKGNGVGDLRCGGPAVRKGQAVVWCLYTLSVFQ